MTNTRPCLFHGEWAGQLRKTMHHFLTSNSTTVSQRMDACGHSLVLLLNNEGAVKTRTLSPFVIVQKRISAQCTAPTSYVRYTFGYVLKVRSSFNASDLIRCTGRHNESAAFLCITNATPILINYG